MEITTETSLINALSKCPDEIISIDIRIENDIKQPIILKNCINVNSITIYINTRGVKIDLTDCNKLVNLKLIGYTSKLNLTNCNNLVNLKLENYTSELNLTKCINLESIFITRFNIPLDLSNCTNLISINLPQYDYTINLTEFKNLNNIILSPINNSFNMIHFKKINKLEDTITQLIEKIEQMTQNKSYFT